MNHCTFRCMQCTWPTVPDTDSCVTCTTNMGFHIISVPDTDSQVTCSKNTAFYKLCADAWLPHWLPYIHRHMIIYHITSPLAITAKLLVSLQSYYVFMSSTYCTQYICTVTLHTGVMYNTCLQINSLCIQFNKLLITGSYSVHKCCLKSFHACKKVCKD